MINYFVSYNFVSEQEIGFGSANLSRNEKIKNGDDIKVIEEMIREKNNFKGVVLMYWRLFEE